MKQVAVIAAVCVTITHAVLFNQSMKQFTFIAILTLLCAFGAMFHPFWAILLYYGLSILRPQHKWAWAMPMEIRWSLIAAVLVILATLIRLPTLIKTARMNFTSGLIMVYSCMLILAVLTAYDPHTAMNWGIEYAKILVIVLLVPVVFDRIQQVRWIALMALLVIGYICWDINSEYYRSGRLEVLHHGFGGLDNNGAGLKFAMALPFAYVFMVISKAWWQKAAAAVIAVLIGHVVMLTYSRGAMLASLVGIAWILFQHRPRKQALLATGAIACIVIALAGPEIRDRFNSTFEYQQDASAQSRFDGWTAAWDIVSDHPILGTGIRNSNHFTQNYGADLKGRTIHNQYLQIAADTGLPALVVYVVIVFAAFFHCHWTRKNCQRHAGQLTFGHAKPFAHRGPFLPRKKEKATPKQIEKAQLAQEKYEAEINAATEAHHNAVLCLGIQASLIMFAFGALFISLEVFEMPWMLIALAGVLPRLAENELNGLTGPNSITAKPVVSRPPSPYSPDAEEH